jgi:hypothetical protein
MKTRPQSPILAAPAPPLLKTEESPLYRQPMTDRQWQANMEVLKTRVVLLDQEIVQSAAREIRVAYDWLEPHMERYCEITCHACSDSCCHAARIFYNQTDMLSIIALDTDPPAGQTRARASDPCRYLTRAGCSLKRVVRPYVCVWYLCEAQMDLYQEEFASAQRRFVATLESLRANRLRLESHYESHFPPLPR